MHDLKEFRKLCTGTAEKVGLDRKHNKLRVQYELSDN